nr:MAG: ORF1 [TTV-like mini virus]
MPPYNYYYRRWNNRRPWNRRRRRPRRQYRYWGLRKTFRRRPTRRRRVRKTKFHKKLKKIKVYEWQPTKIVKCKIKGNIALIQGGKGRQGFNYAQYQDSYIPSHQGGGGTWSIMVFSLGALYQEWERLNNVWTKSNNGLPFARYNGCVFKFYREKYYDYVVHYSICYPMTDTEEQHLQSHPNRMLQLRKKVIVHRTQNQNHKKPYVRKRIRPPAMLQSHWYFQQELCNTGLLLITTSICNLNDYWLSPNSFSNNISFYSVNTRLFTNPNFQNIDSTLGYIPKQDVFLYASYNGQGKPKWQDLVYLGNTNHYDPGTPGGEPNAEYPFMNKKYWGNPFHYQTANQQVKMYISATNPTTIQKTQLSQQASVTETDEPVFQECRYNPYADKGYGNECYFLSNTISKKKVWDPPDNKKLYNFGYPIWLLLWGWGDWQLKLKEINQIGINYQLIFKTDKILPKLPAYIPVNYNFVYVDEDSKPLTETDKLHWYPKYDFQLNTISNICDSGPGTYQFDDTNSVQANCNYCFYFKWGGCPAPMEGVKDPCNQPQFPIPNQVTEGFKIQDPNTNKKEYLYMFDERRQTLTKTAQKRICKDIEPEKFVFTDGNLLDLPTTLPKRKKTSETSSEEEEKTPLQKRIELLKFKQRLLHKRLNRLTKHHYSE